MTGLVFLHGWGYGPETWDTLAKGFGLAPVAVLDAGYFGERRMGLPPNLTDSLPPTLADNPGGWVGVGHSLGFARLLEMDVPWRGLVGIGGFLRFCPKPGKTTGTPADLLEAMLERLDTAPQEVLARFHKRCGHQRIAPDLPQAGGPADGLARLRADLERLRGLDLSSPKHPVPTLLLHAQDDRIVPLDLAREAQALVPGSRLALLESGGHALPMTRSQDCLRLVREFLHGLG